MSETCAKCDSDKIIPRARVMDKGDYGSEGDLNIAIDGNPEAFLFKDRTRWSVSARVCGSCGFVEFYAANPETIYSAYQNQLKHRK
jgi:predicted nucleic-acid-binding Zn-ribbon protein